MVHHGFRNTTFMSGSLPPDRVDRLHVQSKVASEAVQFSAASAGCYDAGLDVVWNEIADVVFHVPPFSVEHRQVASFSDLFQRTEDACWQREKGVARVVDFRWCKLHPRDLLKANLHGRQNRKPVVVTLDGACATRSSLALRQHPLCDSTIPVDEPDDHRRRVVIREVEHRGRWRVVSLYATNAVSTHDQSDAISVLDTHCHSVSVTSDRSTDECGKTLDVVCVFDGQSQSQPSSTAEMPVCKKHTDPVMGDRIILKERREISDTLRCCFTIKPEFSGFLLDCRPASLKYRHQFTRGGRIERPFEKVHFG